MSNSLMQPDLQLDTTLTKDGYAADSKAVGDKLITESHRFECGDNQIDTTGETGKWSFKRIDYIYHHIKNPIPVVTHYKTNIEGTAFTISAYDDTGFTVGVYNASEGYRAFTWVAIEPE